MDEKVNLRLHNAMIEAAVCEFWEKKIAETEWNRDGDHEFSERHTAKIGAVIKKHKTEAKRKKIMRLTNRAAIFSMFLCTISFITLICMAATSKIYIIRSNMLERFYQEHPNASLDGDAFQEWQTDKQINQIENIICEALIKEGLPPDTNFQVVIDGWLNVTLRGDIDKADAEKLMPYIAPMASLLSAAYANENKNQLYYIQSVILSLKELQTLPSDDESAGYIYETTREYRRIIRDYMLTNGIESEAEIMEQCRVIAFHLGVLIFAEK